MNIFFPWLSAQVALMYDGSQSRNSGVEGHNVSLVRLYMIYALLRKGIERV